MPKTDTLRTTLNIVIKDAAGEHRITFDGPAQTIDRGDATGLVSSASRQEIIDIVIRQLNRVFDRYEEICYSRHLDAKMDSWSLTKWCKSCNHEMTGGVRNLKYARDYYDEGYVCFECLNCGCHITINSNELPDGWYDRYFDDRKWREEHGWFARP